MFRYRVSNGINNHGVDAAHEISGVGKQNGGVQCKPLVRPPAVKVTWVAPTDGVARRLLGLHSYNSHQKCEKDYCTLHRILCFRLLYYEFLGAGAVGGGYFDEVGAGGVALEVELEGGAVGLVSLYQAACEVVDLHMLYRHCGGYGDLLAGRIGA